MKINGQNTMNTTKQIRRISANAAVLKSHLESTGTPTTSTPLNKCTLVANQDMGWVSFGFFPIPVLLKRYRCVNRA